MSTICICCNYETDYQVNFNKHLKSKKHISNLKLAEISQKLAIATPKLATHIECKYCGQKYKHKSSLSKHIKYSCTKNKDEDLKELVRLMNQKLETKNRFSNTTAKST